MYICMHIAVCVYSEHKVSRIDFLVMHADIASIFASNYKDQVYYTERLKPDTYIAKN